VFTGPESSGKTTLSNLAQKKWGGPLVREVAREYLENNNTTYSFEDVIRIGVLQWESENQVALKNDWYWCDTDLLTIIIWTLDKFGKTDPAIEKLWKKQVNVPGIYLLCYPDIPWAFDPLRENPHDRERIFDLYLNLLHDYHLKYILIKGDQEERCRVIDDTFRHHVIL
jgi:nicotinamide riboside kinase